MRKRKRRKPANPWPPRARRLPPKHLPPDFVAAFGELDPALCRRVAEFVDYERRQFKTREAVREIGDAEGFGVTKGFSLLMAGRFLIVKASRSSRRFAAR